MNKAGSAKFCLPLTHSLTHTNPYLPSYSIKTPKLEAEKEQEKKIKITQSPLLSQKPKHLQFFFFKWKFLQGLAFLSYPPKRCRFSSLHFIHPLLLSGFWLRVLLTCAWGVLLLPALRRRLATALPAA